MLGSGLDLDKVRHVFYHLALAANKLEAKKEIDTAISESSKVGKSKKIKTRGKKEAESKKGLLLKKINNRLASVEKKIKRIKNEGSYDPKSLLNIELKVEIIKRRIKKLMEG